MIRKILSAALLLPLFASIAFAQSNEAFNATVSGVDTPTVIRGGTPITADTLFAGTALNGPGGNNDTFLIDPVSSAATSYLSGVPIWGATYDPVGERILYTTEGGTASAIAGAPLFEIPISTGVPNLLGVIKDGAGTDFRIDGLAFSGGVLYGSRAAALNDGIYTIDLTTLTATLIIPSTDSISGIDADPATGIIYGVDDTITSLVQINIGAGTITPVVGYPDVAAENDIDGLAVGNGRAYLIPDDTSPGLIYVYNLGSGTFEAPLTAPWGAVDDTFSGGAYVTIPTGQPPAPLVELPTFGTGAAILLAVLLGGLAMLGARRRRAHSH